MKPPAFAYCAPATVEEALDVLAEHDGAKVLAGGQSLIPLLNMRLAAPDLLVDITRIAGLDRIDIDAGEVRIGATATHEQVRRHPGIASAVPLVTEALGWVAHPVIRNRGTAVGSIVHADPAAELPAVLTLLGGYVQVLSASGRRDVAASDFFVGPMESDVRPGELVAAAAVPRPSMPTRTAFVELARRHGDYALAGVGVRLTLAADDTVHTAAAVCIGTDPTPRVIDLTADLAGQPVGMLEAEASIATLRSVIEPETDVHATGDYRRHLAGVLLGRALTQAGAKPAGKEAA
ncbi:MAG: xanthine dehydrogenase family protein subunit M [Nitriliruptoraceae bacterium]